jgi:AcrR family transcriptional regulator
MTSSKAAPRTLPLQTRSKATLEHLLATAMQILEQDGLEAFNTNLLAERAGVGVRAIYRYFPNKLAILVMLAERMRERERLWVGDLGKLLEEGDWRAAVDRSLDSYYAAAAKEPGMVALRAAIRVLPELRAVEAEASEAFQKELASTLTGLGVELDRRHMKALCQTIIESAATLLDAALTSPPAHARRLLDELKRMIRNLLADYVEA